MSYGECIKGLRLKRGMPQIRLAAIADTHVSTIKRIESEVTNPYRGVSAQAIDNILASDVFTEKEKKSVRRALRLNRGKSRRIPNIPDFYERLYQIEDEHGRLCPERNMEVLNDLRKDLGVVVSTKRNGTKKNIATAERLAFGKILREFRGRLSIRKLAEEMELGVHSISALERGQWSSSSSVMKELLVHEYFNDSQRSRLQKAYDDLVRKEEEDR